MTNITDFPLQSFDKIRYSDTDRQGHVNNAAFVTFLETGRVEILYDPDAPLLAEHCTFVIAALQMNFKREIHWPGMIDIGTAVLHVGRSSLRLLQGLFQAGELVAEAETVIVQISDEDGSSVPLTPEARERLSGWLLPAGAP